MILNKLLLVWVAGLALSLIGLPAGAQECPTKRVLRVESIPPIGLTNPPIRIPVTGTIETYHILRNDLQQDTFEDPRTAETFNTFYHPFGDLFQKSTLFFQGTRTESVKQIGQGPVPCVCDHCGDDQNAGYILKIYSKDQNPTRGEKFDKPILITQGFDPNFGLSEGFTFGKFHEMLNTVNDTATGLDPTGERGLLREAYDEGYDIALLLFKNPLIDLRVNAKVVLEALRWLESRTVAREGSEPVIIGPSMGGLITRYALQLAGQNFPASGIRARLFIAFDAPNRGAEIPMSLQALLKYFTEFPDEKDRDATIQRRFEILTSASARQMLLSSIDAPGHELTHRPPKFLGETHLVRYLVRDYEAPGSPHGEFMNEINAPGFLSQINNITHPDPAAGGLKRIHTAAIANGSGFGHIGKDQGLTADITYGDIGCELCFVDLLLRSSAPGEPHPHAVFDGNITDADALLYIFSEPAFIENSPGGFRDTYQVIHDELDGKVVGEEEPFRETLRWNFFKPEFENHSFIPTLSALGLLDVDINNNATWFASPTIGRSMFRDSFAPFNNQEHVAVTPQNKKWFLDEIHRHGPFTSIKLFDATPVRRTGPQTSPGQAQSFASTAIEVRLPPEHTAVISSDPHGTGFIVVDNFLIINGQNACLHATGRLSCLEEIRDISFPENVDIENVLQPIPPLDVTGLLPSVESKVLFDLQDVGIIAGNTDLYLVIKPRTLL